MFHHITCNITWAKPDGITGHVQRYCRGVGSNVERRPVGSSGVRPAKSSRHSKMTHCQNTAFIIMLLFCICIVSQRYCQWLQLYMCMAAAVTLQPRRLPCKPCMPAAVNQQRMTIVRSRAKCTYACGQQAAVACTLPCWCCHACLVKLMC